MSTVLDNIGGSYNINTLDDLIQLVNKGIPEGVVQIKISKEISTIKIRICGEGYGATIPGDQLRTLSELQDKIYRLAAYTMTGSYDIRALGDNKQKFELKVSVKEGSCLTEIFTENFFVSLFEQTFGRMSNEQITFILFTLICSFTGLVAYNIHSETIEFIEKEKTAQKTTDSIKDIVAAHGESIKSIIKLINESHANDKVIKSSEYITETLNTTATNIAKRGTGISSMEIAGKIYDSEDLEQLRKRTKAEMPDPVNIDGNFLIVSFDKSTDPWTLKLQNIDDKSEVSAKLSLNIMDLEKDQTEKDVYRAFSENLPVNCQIVPISNRKNLIVSVSLVDNER